MTAPSSDAIGALEFPDIGHDRGHVAPAQPFDWGHVTKTPVVGPDAERDRALERFVTMVSGLIDDVDQRRGDPVLSGRVRAVAGRAVCVVGLLPQLSACREGVRQADRRDQRPAARTVLRFAEKEMTRHTAGGDQDEQDRAPPQ